MAPQLTLSIEGEFISMTENPYDFKADDGRQMSGTAFTLWLLPLGDDDDTRKSEPTAIKVPADGDLPRALDKVKQGVVITAVCEVRAQARGKGAVNTLRLVHFEQPLIAKGA